MPNGKLAPLVLLVFLGQTSSVTTSSIPWLLSSRVPFVAFCPILSHASWSWLSLTLVPPFNAMPSWENVSFNLLRNIFLLNLWNPLTAVCPPEVVVVAVVVVVVAGVVVVVVVVVPVVVAAAVAVAVVVEELKSELHL